MRKDGSFSYVQPAEGDGPEVDGPNVLGDFFKPKVFASQQVGDIDPGGACQRIPPWVETRRVS